MLPPGGYLLAALFASQQLDEPGYRRKPPARPKRRNPKRQAQKAQRIARKKSRRSV